MAYRRFLTDNDYISLVTEEHMTQILREKHDRLVQAEERAEQRLLEYLSQYYEIEKLLLVGKCIYDYNPAVSYPANAYFRRHVTDVDGKETEKIFKTLTAINGYKKPTSIVYWEQVADFIDPDVLEKAPKYSQLRMYAKGDIVKYGTEYWRCLVPHGFNLNEIHIPGCVAWREVETTPWAANMNWEQHKVVSYGEGFYTLTEEQDTTPEVAPDENENWAMIGDYSLDYEYSNEESDHDYVVAEGKVFLPILNPNTTAIVEEVNITLDDPRNASVVENMAHIAIWYALQLISPTNISEAKRWAFEDSMKWLYDASKFKINPQLPRKLEQVPGEPKVDWALATFQRSYNPNENPWLI
jgi:hypothetical protein